MNRLDVHNFLSALFQPDEWIELRLLPSREQRWIRLGHNGGIEPLLPWLTARNADGQNIYFGANPRREDGDSKNEGVALARALFIDIDDRGVTAESVRVMVGECNLPEPSIINMTGGGAHCYWLLDEPITDLERWVAWMKALIRRAQSDPGVHDPARILRLPGFANCKYDDRPVCSVFDCVPERSYSLDDFPTPPAPRPKTKIKDAAGSLSEESFAFINGKLRIPEGQRRDTLFRIACDFAASGWTLEQCVAFIEPQLIPIGLDAEDIYDITNRQIPNAFAQKREPTRRGARVAVAAGEDGSLVAGESGTIPVMLDPNTGEIRELSEGAIGAEFCSKHGHDLMYDERRSGWLAWNGNRWFRSETASSLIRLRRFIEEISAALSVKPSERVRLGRASVVRGVDAFVMQELAVAPSMLDSDPLLLGTPEGVVDLRTGLHRPARREDRITRATAVPPATEPDCPRWLDFLRQAMMGDQIMVEYLQRIAGYCLTGLVTEHALVFAHGGGGNGKGVWINTLCDIWHDYGATADMEALCEANNSRHPTEIAALDGPRLVAAQEVAEGRAWNEARIKSLTGGDAITARYMRQDNFTFRPQFKLIVAGNHQPRFRTVDEAIRRRLHLVPFLFTPAKPDYDLREKLRGEWPGILRWAIDGCLHWTQSRLAKPTTVAAATDGYLGAEDHTGQWCDDCLDFGGQQQYAATSKELVDSWTHWSESIGIERSMTPQRLREAMERRGAVYGYVSRIRGYRGVSVRIGDAGGIPV